MQEKYDEAVKILTKIIEEARAKSDQINVIEALEELVSAYEKSGKFPDALQAQKEYFDLYKKFNSERNNEKVHILETLHRTRETEAELAHQKLIAEEAIQQAERTRNYFEELNKIKGEFIDSATHDLKNPLTSIRLNASILRRKIDPSGKSVV